MGERIRASRRAGVPAHERRAARAEGAALSATRFACADFVESEVEPGSVDTITCLRWGPATLCGPLRGLVVVDAPGCGVVNQLLDLLPHPLPERTDTCCQPHAFC